MDNGRILTFGNGELAVPGHVQQQAPQEREMTDEEMDAAMPIPCGFKVLVVMPEVETTFGSGLVKTDDTIKAETTMSVVALVVQLGPDAYMDKERFPSGPYCKPGDYVLIAPYQGQRFCVGKKEFRLLNDDSILGIAADPRSYRRV